MKYLESFIIEPCVVLLHLFNMWLYSASARTNASVVATTSIIFTSSLFLHEYLCVYEWRLTLVSSSSISHFNVSCVCVWLLSDIHNIESIADGIVIELLLLRLLLFMLLLLVLRCAPHVVVVIVCQKVLLRFGFCNRNVTITTLKQWLIPGSRFHGNTPEEMNTAIGLLAYTRTHMRQGGPFRSYAIENTLGGSRLSFCGAFCKWLQPF